MDNRNCKVKGKGRCASQINHDNERISADIVGGSMVTKPPLHKEGSGSGAPPVPEGKLPGFGIMPESSNRCISGLCKHKSVREWFEYINSLESDLVLSAKVVKSLEKKERGCSYGKIPCTGAS